MNDDGMGVLTRHELEKVMRKHSRARSTALRRFLSDAHSLKVGEEMYRAYSSFLPRTSDLRDALNSQEDMKFEMHDTINGYTVKRTA